MGLSSTSATQWSSHLINNSTYTMPQLGDPCARCHKRPSTRTWTPDDSGLSYVHGFYQFWCDVCVFAEQLKHAKAQARRIPELQRSLRRARYAAKKADSGA